MPYEGNDVSDAPSFPPAQSASVASVENRKIADLPDMSRDLKVHYMDADGNPLKNEAIKIGILDENHTPSLDEQGLASIKKAPFGQIKTEQPSRQ